MKRKSQYLNISERKVLLRVLDIIFYIFGIYFISNQLDAQYIPFSSPNKLQWLLIFVAYFSLFGHIFEIYNLKDSNNKYTILGSVFITTLVTVVFYIFTPYITPSLPENRIEVVYLFLAVMIPVTIWRFIYIKLVFSPKFFKNVLLVGNSDSIKNLLFSIRKRPAEMNIPMYISNNEIEGEVKSNYKNIENVNLFDVVDEHKIDEVIIASKEINFDKYNDLNSQIIQLFEKGINIKSIENLYEEITFSIPKEKLNVNFYQNISYSKNHENSFYLFFGRVLDVIISIIGLTFLLGVIPFVLIGNLIGNRGPLFYGQERVGLNGENFKILKFRSMVVNAEKGGAVWAKKNDTRITFFGKFLRRTRIDEIPQFWNILEGKMSLIGPRPERPEFVKSLRSEFPFYAIRNVVRPGLTGWAQVMFPYASTLEEQEKKLRFDLYYIKHRSALLDLKIILKTISTVLHFRGQ